MGANQARSWQHTREEYAPQRERKVAVKVKRQGWITKGEKALYTLFAIGMLIAGIVVVSFASSTDTLNRQVLELERTVQNQQMHNEGLLFEVKELSTPERITQIAKENGLRVQDSKVKQANAFNN